MKPDKYQRLAERTECDQEHANSNIRVERCLSTRLLHSVVGLTGEVGELASAVERWLWYDQELDTTNVKEELGDCLWYIAEACNALDLSMNDVMKANIAKLRKRYPDRYSDQSAKEENRNREVEREAISPELTTELPTTITKEDLARELQPRDSMGVRYAPALQQHVAPVTRPTEGESVGTQQFRKTDALDAAALSNVVDILRSQLDTGGLADKAIDDVIDEVVEQTGHGFAEPPEDDEDHLEVGGVW